MFIGFFITYGSYFILTASGDDRPGSPKASEAQPEALYRNEALPIQLPPEDGVKGSDPARDAIVSESKKEPVAEKASKEPETLPEVERPGEHLATPPAPIREQTEVQKPAGEVKAEAAKIEEKGKEKVGIFRRIKRAFSRKEHGQEAEAVAAQAEKPAQEAPSQETPAPVADEAKAAEEAAAAKAPEAAEAKPAEEAKPKAEEAKEKAPFALGQVKTVQEAENTVTLRSGPSPQDQMCRTFIFDASKSQDPDNDTLSYEWDFGDGSPKSADIRVRHTFPKPGEYKVTLTVTDNTKGDCAVSTTQKVITANRAPIAVGVFPTRLNIGQTGIFDGRLSEDTPGDRLSFEWDFGDGTKESGPVLPHRFSQPGEYRVVLTVKDSSNSSCDTSLVASAVLVEKLPVEEKFARLESPEPVRPRLREPALPEIPPFEVKEAGETEMDGLLGQVRRHQGEAPAPKPEEPEVKVVVQAPRPPATLVSAETPLPERPPAPPAPKFLPDTHRYVLAWAGGYLVHSPTVSCESENRISYRNRIERDLERLLHTVTEDREKIHKMMDTDSTQTENLKAQELDIALLADRIDQFRTEALDINNARIDDVSKGLNNLNEEVRLNHQKLLAMTAQNTKETREFGDELLQHARDDIRHKTPADKPSLGEKYRTAPPADTQSVRLPPEEK
jgi:PKD repeat protein